jgi:hypothetical protein
LNASLVTKLKDFTLFIRKKTLFPGYALRARLKGLTESDDTIEPLHLAAQHHKIPLLAYLESNKDLVAYIKENKVGCFSK